MATASPEPANLRIGEWLLEHQLNQLTGPDGSVHLEPRTSAVLLELAKHAGQVRTREELLDAVWGDAFVGEAALTHCIWELRKAFGDDAKNPSFIQTVPRRGYLLVAPVSQPPRLVVRALVVWVAGSAEGVDEPSVTGSLDLSLLALLAEHGGESVGLGESGTAGGIFERPAAALRFALSAQSKVDESLGGLPLAIGVHLGEVEFAQASASGESGAERRATGPAVEIVRSLASTGLEHQVLVSRTVFDLGRAADEGVFPEQASLRWLAHGEYLLEGVEDPLEVFEVGVEGFAPLVAPDPSSRIKLSGAERTVLGWRPAPGLAIPQRPHWNLTRKLGEGGFGEVWLTEHAKTGDLRVFKFCVEVDRLRALQREVTLFRLLKESLGNRRDITRILDWNFEEAPYFLEIEYVEGGSFADWAVAQGGLDEVPLGTRIEIVAQAGEALAAAHSIGVLHKDVKPGNLLIGSGRAGRPRVCLADFGISRIADPARLIDAGITALGLTETQSATSTSESGTRLYLAPELLEGKMASIQSDIYALGVVLYQAVLGRFDRAIGPGWQRDIDDPLLREDIARCVDLAPERRPMSASDIAQRLRSLEERRAEAERERRQLEEAEKTRRALVQAQRRRKALSFVAGTAAVVAAVVTVLTLLAMGARKKADASRERAETLVSYMLGDLRGTLEGVGRLDAMGDTAEEVLAYYASLDVEEMTDEALSRRAQALRQIGDVRMRTGSLSGAEEAFEEAARVADRLVARDPERTEWQAERADGEFWLGDVLRRQGDFQGAREAYEAHRAIYEGLVGRESGQRLWQRELAYGHGNVGGVLADLGESDAALRHMERRLEIIEGLVAAEPEDRGLQLDLASSLHLVGRALERRGDLAGALEYYRRDHEILRSLAAANPGDTRLQERLATSAGYVGLAHWLRGDAVAARASYEIEVGVFDGLCVLDPDNVRWQRNRAVAVGKVGRTLEAEGQYPEAEKRYRKSLATFEELVAKDASRTDWRRDLAGRRELMAHLLLGEGRGTEALNEVEQARRELRALLAERAEDRRTRRLLGSVEILRGELLQAMDNPGAARLAREAALGMLEPLTAGNTTGGGVEVLDLDPWARSLIALGRLEEVQPVLDQLRAGGYRAPEFVAFCRRHGVNY